MDLGNEVRVIEVDEPAMTPNEVEEIMVEDAATESPNPYPRVI